MASGGVILFGSFNEEETSSFQSSKVVAVRGSSLGPQIPTDSQTAAPESSKPPQITSKPSPSLSFPTSRPGTTQAPLTSSSAGPEPWSAVNGSHPGSEATYTGNSPVVKNNAADSEKISAVIPEDHAKTTDVPAPAPTPEAAPPSESPPDIPPPPESKPSLPVTSSILGSPPILPGPFPRSEPSGEPDKAPSSISTSAPEPSVQPPAEVSNAAPAPPTPPAPPAPKPAPKSWAALVQRNATELVFPSETLGSRGLASGVPHPLKPNLVKGPSQGRQAPTQAPAQGSGVQKPAAATASGGTPAVAGGGGRGGPVSGEGWQSSLKEAEAAGSLWLKPRGLVNTGNSCFLNSTLQGLLACHPFLHLLQTVGSKQLQANNYPTLSAFTQLVKEFEPIGKPGPATGEEKSKSSGHSVDVGRPLAPTMFETVLTGFNPNRMRQGHRSRQEDAQEFLSFVMDRMHEELLRLEGRDGAASVVAEEGKGGVGAETETANGVGEGEDSEEWETVGPKNKTAVTRTHVLVESALSDIFGGQLRSVVKSKGLKASAVVQPFLLLQLDILVDPVRSLEDALALFAAPESLEGYKVTSGRSEVVSASKAIKIQALPRVLILHLMRFSFGPQGSSKVHKPIHFPQALTVSRELLAGGGEARHYELFATVTHHGKDPGGGHYTSDCKQWDGRWLRFDDGQVSHIPISRVLHDQAYLLMYKRVEG